MIEVFESNGLIGTAYRPLDGKHGMTGYHLRGVKEKMKNHITVIGPMRTDGKNDSDCLCGFKTWCQK